MFSALCFIAGVDREVIRQCPGSDRIWAVQLGLSLIMSFIFVTAVSYFSLSYFLPGFAATLGAAVMVGLIVVLFDRALFQADWYDMGLIHDLAGHQQGGGFAGWLRRIPFLRLLRLAIRLGISLVIALTLSLLVEVALFGPTLVAHMQKENFRDNANFRTQMAGFEAGLDAEALRLKTLIADLDARISPLALAEAPLKDAPAGTAESAERVALAEKSAALKDEISAIEDANAALREDIRAEQTGARTDGKYTGKPGCGPGTNCDIYKFRLAEAELMLARKSAERAETESKLAALEQSIAMSAEDARLQPEEIAGMETQRKEAAAALAALGEGREAALAGKRAQLELDGVYVPLRDDPVARVSALRQLKSDAKYGAALTALSLVIRIFVAFLELAPVIAKIFFSPPSAYALWLKENIAASQTQARLRISKRIEEVSSREGKIAAVLNEARDLREQRVQREQAARKSRSAERPAESA